MDCASVYLLCVHASILNNNDDLSNAYKTRLRWLIGKYTWPPLTFQSRYGQTHRSDSPAITSISRRTSGDKNWASCRIRRQRPVEVGSPYRAVNRWYSSFEFLSSQLKCSGDWGNIDYAEILLITIFSYYDRNREDKHTLYIIIGGYCCFIGSCLWYRNDDNPDGHLFQWTTALRSSSRSDLLCFYPRPLFMLWMRYCL